jgi:hypothetical protein
MPRDPALILPVQMRLQPAPDHAKRNIQNGPVKTTLWRFAAYRPPRSTVANQSI